MKNLFFLCAFLFLSMEMSAQLYIVKTVSSNNTEPILQIEIYDPSEEDGLSIVDLTYLIEDIDDVSERTRECWVVLNTILNDLISQGYVLLPNSYSDNSNWHSKIYFLAAPWTTVGLTETNSSELDLSVSPNPANDYINVEVDFKIQPSEFVLISEGGYVYFKKDISNVMSGQEFRFDISNIPAGKYLVTVKNDKQYLTPKKLIVF